MPQDTGIYTCIAINDHGTASSSASIKVQGDVEQGDACVIYFHLCFMQDNVGKGPIYFLRFSCCASKILKRESFRFFVHVNKGWGNSRKHCLIDVFCIYAHVKASQRPQLDP